MSSYNLDEDLEESFDFKLGGHTYKLRYPTTEEVQHSADLKTDKAKTDWMYGLVSSDEPDAPPISEALAKSSIKVLQKFNEMIRKQFNLES